MVLNVRIRRAAAAAGLLLLAITPETVLAHAGERAYVLLLPTQLYIAGGTAVVALSFALVLWLPGRWFAPGEPVQGAEPNPSRRASFASLAVIAVLVAAGYLGSRDPLVNPLPTAVWSLWWVGITFLHAVFGNLWSIVNPLGALGSLTSRAPRLRPGYWPAVGGYLVFAWFELVFPAPQDPALLAHAILIYFACSLCGMALLGAPYWLRCCDPFTVFFRMVAWLAPLGFEPADTGRARVKLRWPGAGLLRGEALPPSGVVFVILVLASVSFDGLSRSFWWLDLVGENPLEYPGRTALMGVNTLGLLVTVLVFLAAYGVTALAGARLAGASAGMVLTSFVLSVIPIAFGYHFSHYLPAFLVDSQYAVRALSDPFELGWNLLGTANLHVTASFLGHHASVEVIWYMQTGAIVAAHVCAVVVAHRLALRYAGNRRALIAGQLPSLCLMIGYTLLGLWLLSTPISA